MPNKPTKKSANNTSVAPRRDRLEIVATFITSNLQLLSLRADRLPPFATRKRFSRGAQRIRQPAAAHVDGPVVFPVVPESCGSRILPLANPAASQSCDSPDSRGHRLSRSLAHAVTGSRGSHAAAMLPVLPVLPVLPRPLLLARKKRRNARFTATEKRQRNTKKQKGRQEQREPEPQRGNKGENQTAQTAQARKLPTLSRRRIRLH